MLSAVIAMTALSESEHGDGFRETSDPLRRKYYTNGSRPPITQQWPNNTVLGTAARLRIEMNVKGHGGAAARDGQR